MSITSGSGLSSTSSIEDNAVVLTADKVLIMGLQQVFTDKRINRVKGDATSSSTNHRRFKDHYGVSPVVVAALFEDLQEAEIPGCRLA